MSICLKANFLSQFCITGDYWRCRPKMSLLHRLGDKMLTG